jgi:hypothetical protein
VIASAILSPVDWPINLGMELLFGASVVPFEKAMRCLAEWLCHLMLSDAIWCYLMLSELTTISQG